ncbi:MAG TPA: hypothetical protein ENJ86_00325 [Methylothermaceae bacterium]|nr:hypothetical protein [Methylothermaceae bacterium]
MPGQARAGIGFGRNPKWISWKSSNPSILYLKISRLQKSPNPAGEISGLEAKPEMADACFGTFPQDFVDH